MMPYWEKIAKIKKEAMQNGAGTTNRLNVSIMTPNNAIQLGLGSDNKLQPDRPVAVDYSSGKPVVLHEGEQLIDTGNKRIVKPVNNMPNLKLLGTNQEQMQGVRLEEQGVPGMQAGGEIYKTGVQQMQQPQQMQQQVYSQPQQIQGANLISPVKSPEKQNFYDISQTVNNLEKQVNKQAEQGTGYLQSSPKVTNAENAMQQGLLNLNALAQGTSPVYDRVQEQAMTKTGAAHSAEKAAQQQQMAQRNVSNVRAALLGQNLERQQAMERGDIQSQIATQKAAAQEEAGKQLLTAGQQVAQYEQTKLQDQYQKDLQKINMLLESGGMENIKIAEQIATQIYGQPMDFKSAKIADVQQRMNDLGSFIEASANSLSDDALQTLANSYGDLWKNQTALKGLEFTDEQIADIKNNLMTGSLSDPINAEALNISSNMVDWWTEGEGMPLQMQMSDDYKALQLDVADPNISQEQRDLAGKKLGELVGTVFYATNGYPLSNAQKEFLEKQGYGHLVTTEAEQTNTDANALVDEYVSGGRADWDNLLNKYKKGEVTQEQYQKAITAAPSYTIDQDISKRGAKKDRHYINSLHNNSIVNMNNDIWEVTGREWIEGKGRNERERYTLKNKRTGETTTITSQVK